MAPSLGIDKIIIAICAAVVGLAFSKIIGDVAAIRRLLERMER
jgi:hypothetical protein